MAVTHFEHSHPAAFKHARELLMMEQGRERVIRTIEKDGLSEEDARALVAEAWGDSRGDRRGEGRAELVRGIAMVAGGLISTLVSLFESVTVGSPVYIVFTGLLLYGAFSIISGVKKLAS